MACEEGAAETQLRQEASYRLHWQEAVCPQLAGPGERTAKRPWLSSRILTSDVLQLWPVPLMPACCPPPGTTAIQQHTTVSSGQRGWPWRTYLSGSSPGSACMLCDTTICTGRHCAPSHTTRYYVTTNQAASFSQPLSTLSTSVALYLCRHYAPPRALRHSIY